MKTMHLLLACLLIVTLVSCTQDPDEGDDDDTAPSIVDAPDLTITSQPELLTELALEAIAATPDWLQDDLAVNLLRMEDDLQDELAALIVDAQDHYMIDEIAFSIAHTSYEVLSYTGFYPELLLENAEGVYAADMVLEYVQLEDVGEPGVDDDFYTTATYRVELEDGTVEDRTIDREMYYWNVVHPRIEDEPPLYIDAWNSDNSTTAANGYFWRAFLWERAVEECPEERECPVLENYFEGVDVLWKSHSGVDDNGAMQKLVEYVREAIDWGAGDERPVQPTRVYTVGCGNCGEHADLSAAAARTALVPCWNVGARANDHTWNEFWDDGWHGWEPINNSLDYMGYYSGGVGRDLVDNDCDGTTDLGDDPEDHDGDGISGADGDCNDGDAQIYPGATEVLNGWDDNCDGVSDEGHDGGDLDWDGDGYTINDGDCDDVDPAVSPAATETQNGWDEDCDGWADNGFDDADWDADGDLFSLNDGDCDDTDAAIFPGTVEVLNGRDDDCDGIADNGFADSDLDGDNDYYSIAEGDCDDTNPNIYPGCPDGGNGIDDDCNGTADYGVDTSDADSDGYSIADGDCNDTDAAINPGMTEVNNARDDNCDGVADEGFVDHDRDGDGYTMADGDCDDTDGALYPGAAELGNAMDDSCDGIADEGLVDHDRDGDGWSIFGGDCDDNDPDISPDAAEWTNAADDNCDGMADEGLSGNDRDGDGYTGVEGDCNDLDAGIHPDAVDPSLSGNRLFSMTASRGDTYMSTDRTEDYGTYPSYLDFTVMDENGAPVDGATVVVWGNWGVYGYPTVDAWAAETYTDVDGHAVATVGETNAYKYSVRSAVGNDPFSDDYGIDWLEWIDAYDTQHLDIVIGEMPASPAANETDLSDGADPQAILSFTLDVRSYRVEADGAYYGSSSVTHEGGRLDVFIVNHENWGLFRDEESFDAQFVAMDSQSLDEAVDLPLTESWTLVLSNEDTVASTMTGSVTVQVTPYGDVEFDGETEGVELDFHLPPGELIAIALLP